MQTELLPGELQPFDAQRTHHILDALPNQAYEDIVHLAIALLQAPMASVTLVDAERVWRKASIGLPDAVLFDCKKSTFAARVVANPAAVTVIEDVLYDPGFAGHPYVVGELAVRFYAGAPIVAASGVVVGALGVMDRCVRSLSTEQCMALQRLARQVAALVEVRQRTEHEVGHVYRENEYLQALMFTGTALQAVIDRNYRYRYVNQVYLDYWQKRREEVEGRTAAELIGDEPFELRYKPFIDRAINGEHVILDASLEYPVLGKRHIRSSLSPARDRHGGIIGAVLRIEDITDLKEVELSLRHTVRLLEEKKLDLQRFIYILSHDLREPVNTILNFSGLLREQFADRGASSSPRAHRHPHWGTGDGTEQVRKFLEFVYKGGDRMRSLLEDLLKYVRVDSNQPDSGPVPLDEVFQEVKQDLAAVLERTHAEIVCESLPTVQGDRHMLRVLVQNLIENAIKFVPPGVVPSVHIGATTDVEAWQLTVTDNGVGVRDEHREQIFGLFKRLHSRKYYEGTGLGLATCRRIAELHGGRIWVTAAPQGGSCFHVWLPR